MDRDMQLSIFSRSLLLQSCWSFEGRQNLGFLMSIDPLLRRIYKTPEGYRGAVMRHLGHFNTHPFMASFILGVIGRMEEGEDGTGAERKDFEKIERMKKSMSTALGALGDSFFWGALRPASAAWTILVWLCLWTTGVAHPFFWGALFYLTVFNVPAMWVRWRGIYMGYELKEKVVCELEKMRVQAKAARIRRVGLAAAVLILLSSWLVPPFGGSAGWVSVLVFGVALGLRRRGFSFSKIYTGAICIGCLGAALSL